MTDRNESLESILRDCDKAVRKGLGDKRPSEAALSWWSNAYRRSFTAQLNAGGDWDSARPRVLAVAEKLGKVAAALSNGPIVLTWAAEAAAIAVKADPGCPSTVGAGSFCADTVIVRDDD